MNPVRLVGRSLLALLFAFVLTAQATSQSPEQNPQPLGPYEPTAAPPDGTDWAQDVPAHIAVVDGTATLDRDGRSEKAEENTVLLVGDRLRTERGRVEVLFADGSALDLDHNTRIDFLSDSLVRLLSGRIRLTIVRSTSAIDYRIDAPPGTVAINAPGDYRIALTDTQSGEVELDVAVFRGSAELRNTHGLTLVRPGTHAAVTAGTAPSLPLSVNSAAWDEFDRWAEDQRDARSGGPSATYLPEEVRSYSGAFDSYGSWDYLPTYGQVWYPNVAFGWKPYHHGRWSFAGRFGWYWGSYDRFWGWPTHHYGRWGYAANRWFWMPGYRWSPAWVSWAYAPGYVSWCPLGFYNRPIVGFNTSFVIYPAYVWTVVPRHAFSGPVPVQHYAVPPQAIPASTWSRFVVRPAAPVAPTPLVARAQPIRAPTRGYAVPRSGSTLPAFDSFAGVQPTPSRAPSRVAPSAPATPTAAPAAQSSGRPNLAPQNPLPAPQRALPRASTAPSVESGTAGRSAATLPRNHSPESRAATAVPRNYSPEVRNYSSEPRGASSEPRTYIPDRTATPDRGLRSRVPGNARPATRQSAPEPDRAQPAAQPWTPRNYSPEVGGHVERGLSRIPRTYSPGPGPANPPVSPGGGFLRSRMPESPGQVPPPGSFAAPRGEPRSAPPTADTPRAAPSRATPPPDTGRGQGGGAQAQPSRRGRG